ncbi:CDP-glycerol glycerophosphotransferase family protein [Demequina sp. NBRC 110056]|uniref:CDP-glycerol glycerophosphotransferase family protein n=1 Tax=Demequina sp. NBRC 110056 TaxID=1570345 RepID=UPI0009FED306|nr:CDP-glycerol glycerophosphotransferase family protein [Demequina sp. NBRC 110056]
MPKTLTRSYRRTRNFAARAVRALQDRTIGRWYYAQLPLDPDLVVYTCVWNRAPRGNPLAVYRKQLELAPHLRGVWIVRKQDVDQIPEGIEYVTPRTLDYLRLISTATYFIDDANPHWSLPPRDGQVYVQTHHGTALKYMGADRHYSGKRPTDDTIVTMHRRCQRWTYSLTTSPYLTEVWERAYNNDCVQLEVGFPRNDVLFSAGADARAAARARLGLGEDERAVLYMPTWRTRRGPKEKEFDLTAFAESLPAGTRLLVRDHYYHDKRGRKVVPEQVIDVSKGWEVEDLYVASDALITDYSSAMFDYALLDKPMVLFCYDWDDYRWSRGAYFDITEDAPGQVVTTAEQLIVAMRSGAFESAEYAERRASFRDRFATFEDGRASEKVVRIALLGEDPAPFAGHGYPAEHPAGWTTHPRVTVPADPSLEPRLAPLGQPSPERFIAEADPAEVEGDSDESTDTEQIMLQGAAKDSDAA